MASCRWFAASWAVGAGWPVNSQCTSALSSGAILASVSESRGVLSASAFDIEAGALYPSCSASSPWLSPARLRRARSLFPRLLPSVKIFSVSVEFLIDNYPMCRYLAMCNI